MSHVIMRGENGRRDEVDFGEAGIKVLLHASTGTVELAIEAEDPDRPSQKRRFALVIFHNDHAIIRRVDALMLETNDEWTVARRYMSLENLARITDNPTIRLSAVTT